MIMKKTIAILLVLVIGMAGVFAADATIPANTADIVVNASVVNQALFGVSGEALLETAFDSIDAFSAAIVDSLSVTTQPLANFKATTEVPDGPIVGYLSGINNTGTTVNLGITTTDFTSTSATPIALTVSPATSQISAAAGQLSTLENVAISLTETTPGSIDLAPAADYQATITITVSTT
jgi:hypothetical protein